MLQIVKSLLLELPFDIQTVRETIKRVGDLIPHLKLTYCASVNFSHTKLVKKNFHTKSKPKHSKRREEERKYCLTKSSSLPHIVVFPILYCVFSYIFLFDKSMPSFRFDGFVFHFFKKTTWRQFHTVIFFTA